MITASSQLISIMKIETRKLFRSILIQRLLKYDNRRRRKKVNIDKPQIIGTFIV